jgi:hypothetical protein
MAWFFSTGLWDAIGIFSGIGSLGGLALLLLDDQNEDEFTE